MTVSFNNDSMFFTTIHVDDSKHGGFKMDKFTFFSEISR